MSRKYAMFGLVLFLIGAVLLYGSFAWFGETGTEYEYTVKVEQVNENDMPTESENYDDLSEAEKKVLFEAFKRSDHFLGGAEAYITTEEKLDIETNEWKVVRVKGVPLLMAIMGPEEREVIDYDDGEFLASIIAMAGGTMFAIVGAMISMEASSKRY